MGIPWGTTTRIFRKTTARQPFPPSPDPRNPRNPMPDCLRSLAHFLESGQKAATSSLKDSPGPGAQCQILPAPDTR